MTITVNDNAPASGDDSYSGLHDQILTVSASSGVVGVDSDPDNEPLTVGLVSGPTDGTLQLDANGGFIYTPNAHFAGTDSFTYESNDGMTSSSTATVFLNVTDAAPLSADDFYSTPAGQTLTVSGSGVLTNDYDADGDAMTAQVVTQPSNGSLTLNSNGSFTYIPHTGFTGNDTFTYQASDGILASNTSTVTITVTNPNSNAPVANNDEFATGMNQPLTISGPGVLWNDTAPSGKTLTAVLNTGPANGTLTLNSDGSFTYTPDKGFTGDDSFTYYAYAGGVGSGGVGTGTIHVGNVSMNMPKGPWVPINANDNNGSPWKANTNDMVPTVPDFNSFKPLAFADPQLMPLNITISNPVPTGLLDLEIKYSSGATGRIRLWRTQSKTPPQGLKTAEILPGIYPTTGIYALPSTIYVEGLTPRRGPLSTMPFNHHLLRIPLLV